jgi:ribonuclease HI
MIELYFDGACQPWNPGGVASYGFVVFRDGVCLKEGKGIAAVPGAPEATNNVAEYAGLLAGLKAVREAGLGENVAVMGDSQLAINQVSGIYAVNAEHLKVPHGKACLLVSELRASGVSVSLKWIPREKNEHADRLSNEAAKEYLAQNPLILDQVTLGFGKHKGEKWRDVPQGYRDWLFAKR